MPLPQPACFGAADDRRPRPARSSARRGIRELTAIPGAFSASPPIGSDARSVLAATTRLIGK